MGEGLDHSIKILKSRAAALVIALLLNSSTIATFAKSPDASVSVVADRRLTVTTPAGSGALTLYLSQDWDRSQPAITGAVITVHGVPRNADVYRASGQKALAASRLDPKSVLLIEPQFLDDADVAARRRPAETLHWSRFGWEASAASLPSTQFWRDWATGPYSRP